jgi:hypothetical protein
MKTFPNNDGTNTVISCTNDDLLTAAKQTQIETQLNAGELFCSKSVNFVAPTMWIVL